MCWSRMTSGKLRNIRHFQILSTGYLGYRGRSHERSSRQCTNFNRGSWTRSSSNSSSRPDNNDICEFCHTRHRITTVGCPDFIKFMNLRDYVDSHPKGKLQAKKEEMEKDRSRSRSASVHRSTTTDHSPGSPANDEWLFGEAPRPPSKPPYSNKARKESTADPKPNHEERQWSGSILNDIKSFDVDEIKAAVAMAKIQSPHQPSYNRKDYRAVVAAYCCEATCSDNLPSCAYSKSKKKILVWQKRVKVLKCLRYLNSCPYHHKKIKRTFPAWDKVFEHLCL